MPEYMISLITQYVYEDRRMIYLYHDGKIAKIGSEW